MNNSITLQELQEIKQRAQECPPLSPYVTSKGGVVLMNGPFQMDKANARKDLTSKARLDILRLAKIAENNILK